MSATLVWYLNSGSHIFTGLWGATIPSSLLWEHVLPPYDPDANSAIQFAEAIVALTGQVMTAALISVSLNAPTPDFTLEAIALLIGPYFMVQSIAKLRRWVHAIRDAVSPYKSMTESSPNHE